MNMEMNTGKQENFIKFFDILNIENFYLQLKRQKLLVKALEIQKKSISPK